MSVFLMQIFDYDAAYGATEQLLQKCRETVAEVSATLNRGCMWFLRRKDIPG